MPDWGPPRPDWGPPRPDWGPRGLTGDPRGLTKGPRGLTGAPRGLTGGPQSQSARGVDQRKDEWTDLRRIIFPLLYVYVSEPIRDRCSKARKKECKNVFT